MTTLLEIAASPVAVNREAAAQRIQALGDRLWLLVPFLEYIAASCIAHATTPVDQGHPDDAPLFEIAVYRPRGLYAYIDAVLSCARAHMPGVSADIFARLRLCNALLWGCPHTPPAVAVMTFWWLTTVHSGVGEMVLATEPEDSWWRASGRFERLCTFVDAHIQHIGKSDVSTGIVHARRFQALIAYIHIHHVDTLLLPIHCPQTSRMQRSDKHAIREKYYVPQASPRPRPPKPRSQTRPSRPRQGQPK